MKKKYLVLQEKHSLPNFSEIDRDFEIYSISDEDDILREVLKKMLNMVDHYINILEDIIQPDSRFYTLKEANVLNKSERITVNKTYNKLMYINRTGLELQLNYSEEKAIELINKLFDEWQFIKKDLLPIITALKESWSKNTEIKQEGGYFG